MSAVMPPVLEPRSVATGRGTAWLGEGFDLFRKAPGTWVGITLIWMVISIALGAIPTGIGELISSFLNPVFQAGIVLGCVSLVRDHGLRVEHLFAGFRSPQLGQLLLMSVIMLLIGVAAVLVGVLTVAGTIKGLLAGGEFGLGDANPLTVALVALVVLALTLPLVMLVWFAPALIILHRLPAWPAMKLSLSACLKNLMPFLVYGLVAVVILIVACIPLFLGLLIAVPVLSASVYTSYRDIFAQPA